MSEIQIHGQLAQVDENGDVTVMLPHTTVDDITGVLPISKGGTGVENIENLITNIIENSNIVTEGHTHDLDSDDITGILPIEKGGTGSSTKEEFISDVIDVLPIEHGGTGTGEKNEIYKNIAITEIDDDSTLLTDDIYKNSGWYYFKWGKLKATEHPAYILGDLEQSVDLDNNPSDAFNEAGYLYVVYGNYANGHQIWFSYNMERMYRRMYNGGMWEPWTKINTNNNGSSNSNVFFGLCASGSSDSEKVIETRSGDFNLENGSFVVVNFDSDNYAIEPKLNVDNTGAKDIVYRGVTIASGLTVGTEAAKYYKYLVRGTYMFLCRETCYELVGYMYDQHNIMHAASSTSAGTSGLVPQPEAGDQNKFLRGDGKWIEVIDGDGNIIATPDVSSATGVLSVENGGTGESTTYDAIHNLVVHSPTEDNPHIDLNDLINDSDVGYWYFGEDYAPTNAPQDTTTGYLVVIRGDGRLRKQVWINQGNTNTHQDMYVRTYSSNTWKPWVEIKTRKIAMVGNDNPGHVGWHKVARGTLTGYTNASFVFAVHNTKSYESGILVLDIRSDDGTLTCGQFGWLIGKNVTTSDYILNISGSTWTMYYNVKQQYYRNIFEVIEESGTNTLNAFYLLYSNQNKEATTPTATVTSSAIGYAATAGNASTVNNLTVKTAVPENAGFTDTTYSNMTGATSSAAGTAGLVPAPAAGKQSSFLRGDGTWVTASEMSFSTMTGATSSAAGTAGLVPAPAAGKQASFLRGDGTWVVPTNTTYSNATTSTAGLMSATDKSKLDGIATGANKTIVDSLMSSTSTNPVQNKVIYRSLIEKAPLEHEHPFTFIEGSNVTIESNNNKARIVCIGDDNTLDLSDSTNVSYLPAIVLGSDNTVKGPNGIVVGPGNTVNDASTYVFGYGNTMNDNSIWSFATGYGNRHRGDLGPSFMCGLYGTIGSGNGTMYYNPNYNNNNYALLDHPEAQAFVIGNGYVHNGSPNYSNAFRVNYSGAVYAMTYNTSGADYAEFIKPWADGNPDKEDRVGFMVTIKNGYLEKANDGDYIIGITSGNPAVIGNGDEDFYWKYERDKFNRIIYEPVTEKFETGQLDENGEPIYKIKETFKPKLSNDYDPELQDSYVERRYRPEWSYVGMRGIVPVRDDGSCEAGGFCKCGVNGVATESEPGLDTYYVIERIDDNIISVEVK